MNCLLQKEQLSDAAWAGIDALCGVGLEVEPIGDTNTTVCASEGEYSGDTVYAVVCYWLRRSHAAPCAYGQLSGG